MAGRRCADWRFPTPKQAKAEETARRMREAAADVRNSGPEPVSDPSSLHQPLRTPRIDDPGPDSALPAEYWDAVLRDPRAAGRPWLPVSQMRLSEIPRELLRVECLRCFRTVEIQRLDAVKLYGPHATGREVGNRLLDNGCQHRTGRHEEDGCWPDFVGK
jgi:hypothetical protein